MTDSPKKEPWDLGYDAVADQSDGEAAEDAVSGAITAFSAGFDTSDRKSRIELMLFFINTTARELLMPQPSDADPEKEAAFGKRMHSLAEHLAASYAAWDAHESHGSCAECGESLQLDAEPKAKPGSPKAN